MEIVRNLDEILPQDSKGLYVGDLLTDPNLLEMLIDEIEKKVVGERETIRVILLAAFGTFVENAEKTSYNLLINDESGAGKDWVVTKILELLPKEWTVKRTRISEKVLTYWHNPKFEPDWTWEGKIFYNEDISESVLNCDVFKVMASTGSEATILINQFPTDIKIKGKPVMIVTTASATPNPENIRRFMIVNLDTTIDQTKAIMKRQAEWAKKGMKIEFIEWFTESLKPIQRKNVVIPFADNLTYIFPTDNVFMRTHFSRFLDYIKASAILYQYQREKNNEEFVIATEQDYENARKCFIKFTTNPQMLPLTKDQRKILAIFELHFKEELVDVEDIEGYVTFMSDKWLRVQLNVLSNMGFLNKQVLRVEDSKKKVMHFSINNSYKLEIPEYKSIVSIVSLNDSFNSINCSNTATNIKDAGSTCLEKNTIDSIDSNDNGDTTINKFTEEDKNES